MGRARDISTIEGKYQVVAQLGRGGTADVSLALVNGPSGFSKLVVLKSMLPELSEEPGFFAMFMAEARLAAQLTHANIVQTNEVFDFEGTPVLVMEYLEGQTLAAVVNRSQSSGKFGVTLRLRALTECLLALEYAHDARDLQGQELGLVHRDVSPYNIFLTYDGQVKLLDFGVAKLKTARVHTDVGAIKGRVRYMPPEQVNGEEVDCRADIFAVGVLCWEAVTGKRMWEGRTEVEVIRSLVQGDIPAVRSYCPDIAVEVESIINTALSPDRHHRFASAREMRIALDSFLSLGDENPRVRDISEVVNSLFYRERDETRAVIQEQIVRVGEMARGERTSYQPVSLREVGSHSERLAVQSPASVARHWRAWAGVLLVGVAALGYSLTQEYQQGERATEVGEAALVSLHITGFPSGARLQLDGEILEANPFSGRRLPGTQEHKLRVTAQGYATETRVFSLTQDVDLVVSLRKLRNSAKERGGEKSRDLPSPQASGVGPREPSPSVPSRTSSDGAVVPRVSLGQKVVKKSPLPPKAEVQAEEEVAKPPPLGSQSTILAPTLELEPQPSGCSPPYVIDERGVKKFKVECL